MGLRDWIHVIRSLSTRAQILASIAVRPPRMAGRFAQGEVADAFLAAQVEWLCHQVRVQPPHWTRVACYVLDEPWFSIPAPSLRTHLLLETPVEFRNRSIFTTPEGSFGLRSGRPRVTAAHKRQVSQARQKRYRQRCALGRTEAAQVP